MHCAHRCVSQEDAIHNWHHTQADVARLYNHTASIFNSDLYYYLRLY